MQIWSDLLSAVARLSLSGRGILSLSESQQAIILPTLFICSKKRKKKKRLLLLTWQSKHKTFLSAIASQSSKYCCELSPRQINHEETSSVCRLIAASCLRKHSAMSWTASEKDRICLLHQIETLSGYQPGYVCQPWHTDQMLHETEIQKFCSQEAGRNPQTWLYHANSTIILNQISITTLTECLHFVSPAGATMLMTDSIKSRF